VRFDEEEDPKEDLEDFQLPHEITSKQEEEDRYARGDW
jgi:hypothetical protein